MNRGQFSDFSLDLPGLKRIFAKFTMLSASTFTINRSQGFLAGTAGIVRTGTGVYDFFPGSPPGVELIDWHFQVIPATPGSTNAGSAKETLVNSLVASSKLTATFRKASDYTATDFATGDIVYGYFDIQTVLI